VGLSAAVVTLALLAIAGAAFVAVPLLRPGADERRHVSPTLSSARELQSRRDMLLASLRDLEDDRASDKISLADYEELHQRLAAETLEVLDRLDELEVDRDRTLEAERRFSLRPRSRPPA
jgi:hypothetical protein